jgi:hypothetical protein
MIGPAIRRCKNPSSATAVSSGQGTRAAARGRFVSRSFFGLAFVLAASCLGWRPRGIAADVAPPSAASTKDADASAPVTILDVRAGFAGRFKVGCWTPFEITLQGGRESVTLDVELTVLDGDAVPSRVRSGAITLGAGERIAAPLYAKIGQLKSDVTAGARSENRLLAKRTFSLVDSASLGGILPSKGTLILALCSPLSSDDELSLDQLGAKVASVNDLKQLPTDWWGYEGVDTVILATGQAETSAQLSTATAQLAALNEWVMMGGKLILSVGRQAEKVLGSSGPLSALVPGEFESVVPLRQGTPLETYAETSEPLAAAGDALVLQVPRLSGVRGKIEAYAGNHPRDLPLVVRAPHGFGEVLFVAVDLEQAPFARWPARASLLEKLLGKSASRAAKNDSPTLGQVTTLGFEDLTGQLRGALDQFSDVRIVPFWLVAALVLAYIGCIGPLDYFIVKNLLRRMEATWLTFAVTVVAFSAGAFFLAYALKGRELRVNRIDLVDFDAQSRRVRGTSWANVFSPQIDTYDLSLTARDSLGQAAVAEQSPASAGVIFSWMGLPGSGFGGMDSAAGRGALFTEAYDFSRKLDRMDRVPIAVWSSKALVGRWWHSGAPQVEAELGNRNRLVGTLKSRLELPLVDCVLFYDRWAYPLRQLKPGQSVDIETDLDPQRVDTYLRHVTMQADRNLATPYDRTSFDIPRIVEIMTSHELAGGEKYTGLAHESQGFVDLSGLVNNGRAVLIGRIAQAATTLARDDEPIDEAVGARWTFHRYVFPVQDELSP